MRIDSDEPFAVYVSRPRSAWRRICFFLGVPSLLLVGVGLAGCGAGDPAVPEGTPDAVEQVVSLSEETWAMTADGDTLWVLTGDRGASRVDLASGEIGAQVPGVLGLTYDGSRLYGSTGQAVAEYSPETGAVLQKASLARVGDWLTPGAGRLWGYRWASDNSRVESVIEVDPKTLGVVSEIPVSGCTEGKQIVFAFESVWIACKLSGKVLRVTPSQKPVVAAISTGFGTQHLAVAAGSIWVSNYRANTVTRIDPSSNRVIATVREVGAGIGITAAGDAIWAAGASRLERIDPATNRVNYDIPLLPQGGYYYSLIPRSDSMWISTADQDQVWRVNLP